ncbi:family 78 glycoside hydrolase catalytic domain [Olivibacter sp. XZL3]|uniref:alpha-L-rhamnosidase-related protein n=1 Tax=Olivibacter sp. XZL3 TaxID=1735116 RepID=UPI0010651F4D|nr:family 78 glycoside hydrolase catalytic domain [Olivibacter sp. XZL3]
MNRRSKCLAFILSVISTLLSCSDSFNKSEIFESEAFTLYGNRVVQGSFEAKAISSKEVVSNYKSSYRDTLSPRINFKFSINGKDNELPSGVYHSAVVLPGETEDKVVSVKFGTPYKDETSVPKQTYLASGAKITIRLDLRHVLKAFEEDGFYTNFNGVKFYKEDFGRVYVAGNTEPLFWDFDNLVNHPELEMKDRDGDGVYEITLTLNKPKKTLDRPVWKLTQDISSFPAYSSPYPLTDALYNMAMEEFVQKVSEDGSSLKLDKRWLAGNAGHVNYSVILSIAAFAPELAKSGLMQLVDQDRLVQANGTGGSYPVSTDRALWVIAAWEVYKVTGDALWLKKCYEIAKEALEEDRVLAFDADKGLMRGESSFLNQREQTYPKWMQAADIYESMSTSTNAIHYGALRRLSLMAGVLAKSGEGKKYEVWADSLKASINKHLWLKDKSSYAQYLYGRVYKLTSDRSDALGQALAVLFEVADAEQQKAVIANMPILPFGTACVFPQTTYIPTYQNNAIWPFVQAYATIAAAKVRNEPYVLAGLAAIYRSAAMYLTNKANFRADNGNYEPTLANEDEALSSLAGNLGLVYQVFFGLQFEPEGLRLNPYVPKRLRGERKLSGFKYRDAILDITLSGYGNAITSVSLDGNELKEAFIPGDIKGKHQLTIVMGDNQMPNEKIYRTHNRFAIDMPALTYDNGKLKWRIVEGAANYQVLKNGEMQTLIDRNEINISQNEFAEYQVIAVDSAGNSSFASAPYTVYSPGAEQLVEAENFGKLSRQEVKGYSAKGFVDLSVSANDSLSIAVTIPDTGLYVIDFRYANGNGYVGTGNGCAVSYLESESQGLGAIVFPQRGQGEWSDWGFSNKVVARFNKGTYQLKLVNPPINGINSKRLSKNKALIDYLRVIKIK